MADVRLTVDGTDFAGWKNIRIERAVDTLSGAFSLEVSDRWSAAKEPWNIVPGSACAVTVDKSPVITGYIDVVRASYDATSRSLQISGRDKAADMVDSSALNNPDSWANVTIGKLAAALAEPFHLTVVDESEDTQTFQLVKIQPGETAFESLERYTRQRGVLTISDGSGKIVLTRPGQRRADVTLEQGSNILRASGTADYSQRFSEYLVTGQTAGTDDTSGTAAAQVEGSASDAEIDKNARPGRRLLITAPNSADAANLEVVATWEAIVRAARGSPLTITVQGWYQTPGGRLWQPGEIVQVRSAWLRLPEPADFLINSVHFSKSEGEGTMTELALLRPDAYKTKQELAKQAGTWGGSLDR